MISLVRFLLLVTAIIYISAFQSDDFREDPSECSEDDSYCDFWPTTHNFPLNLSECNDPTFSNNSSSRITKRQICFYLAEADPIYRAKLKQYFTDFRRWAERFVEYKLMLTRRTKNPHSIGNWPRNKILCELKKIPPFALTRSVYPFNANPLGKELPEKKQIMPGKKFNTCALVSSSGRILGTRMGRVIDANEQVCRLNDAPTNGFQRDVGMRTTFRILNNYLLRKLPTSKTAEHPVNFPGERDVRYLGWDVCPVRGPFHQCLGDKHTNKIHKKGHAQDSIGPFFKWRANNRDRDFHFLDPEWMYMLTDFLQKVSPVKLNLNAVPSTGFIGLAYMMHYCKTVHLYQMIPTIQQKMPCKYFGPNTKTEKNFNCSLFPGHQREIEISTLMKLNQASDEDTYGRGHAIIQGLVDLKC